MKEIRIVEEAITRRRGVAELARRTGRSHGHISRVLAGRRKPSQSLAAKLRKLGVELPEA